MQAIVQGIEATDSVPGRGEVIDQGQDFGCVVDGADTPGALTALLTELHEAGARRILTVFGCPGERHKERRPFMGEAAHFKVFSEDCSFNMAAGLGVLQYQLLCVCTPR